MGCTIETDPQIVCAYLSDESGLVGEADAVCKVENARDVQNLILDCSSTQTPLLPIGLQTATTGAAVPNHGYVLSLEKMQGVEYVDQKNKLVKVLPGTVTAQLKEIVAQAGLYYPPDPTSEKECTVGGNIATNASGARTFRWGMTNQWIQAIEVVTGTGEIWYLKRTNVDKNTTGYTPFHDPVSFFVGSEGTLGVITAAWLRLIPDPGPFVAVLAPFSSLTQALRVAVLYKLRKLSGNPRCIELFDSTALSFIKAHPHSPKFSDKVQAILFLEFDWSGSGLDSLLVRQVAPLERHGLILDETVVADTLSLKNLFRQLRHLVPETCNKIAAQYHSAGGLKVSTEFAVPADKLLKIMEFVEQTAKHAGVDILVRYGHVGNGHPHIFMRAKNREEVASLKKLAHLWYKKAIELGGCLSGEHGIGKTRRDFLKYAYPSPFLRAMRSVKTALDPQGILSPGNIFAEGKQFVPEF